MPPGERPCLIQWKMKKRGESNVGVSAERCLHQAVHDSVGFGEGIACMAFHSPQICLRLDFGVTTSLFPSPVSLSRS